MGRERDGGVSLETPVEGSERLCYKPLVRLRTKSLLLVSVRSYAFVSFAF